MIKKLLVRIFTYIRTLCVRLFSYLKKNKELAFDSVVPNPPKKLRLHPRIIEIELSREALWQFVKRFHKQIGIVVGVVIFFSLIGSTEKTTASVATFNPSACLGGWENPTHAEGEPDVSDSKDLSLFHKENSAFLNNQSASLFCGSFKGEVPVDSTPKHFSVSFSWSVDDGSVIHTEPAPFEPLLETSSGSGSSSGDASPSDTSSTEEQAVEIIDAGELPPADPVPTDPIPDIKEETKEEVTEIKVEPAPPQDAPEPSPEVISGLLRSLLGTPLFAQEGEVSAPSPDIQVVVETEAPTETAPEPETIKDEVVIESNPVDTTTPTEEIEQGANSSSSNETIEELVEPSSQGSSEPDSNLPPTVEVTDPFLEVRYTLDGINWERLGIVGFSSWQDVSFMIPLNGWEDVSNVQIELRSITTLDIVPVVYLDAITLSVEYDVPTESDPLRAPNSNDIIITDVTNEGIRVIHILRDKEHMIWYTVLSDGSEDEQIPTEDFVENIEPVQVEVIEVTNNDETLPDIPTENTESQTVEDEIEEVQDETDTRQTQTTEERTSDEPALEPVLGGEVTEVKEDPSIFEAVGGLKDDPFDVITQTDELLFPKEEAREKTTNESKKLHKFIWNLVAYGDVVDPDTSIDIAGGKIFWFSKGATAFYEYNTFSGGTSSVSVEKSQTTEIIFTEPNGDPAVLVVSPELREVVTPLEEEISKQEVQVEEESLEVIVEDVTPALINQ